MKKTFAMLILYALAYSVSAQDTAGVDSTGLPGDNFSLQGALDLFKRSQSPEAFEKILNDESNGVNNLDLNGDNETDYIRVKDLAEKSTHALVLQAVIGENELQDVAVIEIEMDGAESAQLQILGDVDLYGKDVLAEPANEGASGGKGGPAASMETHFMYVNVWFWPCVHYMYMPTYVVWTSPWYWNAYPVWYRPWHPHPWRRHYSQCAHYHPYYTIVHTHRVVVAHRAYASNRSSSAIVSNRYRNEQRKNDSVRGNNPTTKQRDERKDASPQPNVSRSKTGGRENRQMEREKQSTQPRTNTRQPKQQGKQAGAGKSAKSGGRKK